MTDLAQRTLRIEEMPSGTVYGYVLPNIEQMKWAGQFPKPVVFAVEKYLNDPNAYYSSEFKDEDWKRHNEFRARLVSWMVRTLDGEPAKLEWEDVMDPEQFPFDDLEGLFVRGLRLRSSPKAASPEQWAKQMLEEQGWTLTKPEESS